MVERRDEVFVVLREYCPASMRLLVSDCRGTTLLSRDRSDTSGVSAEAEALAELDTALLEVGGRALSK